MATLEKIRSKSVLLVVVIGVALLAFIVGDALTNGRNLFGDHTTVAKIGNQKIDYTEYQRKREELNDQLEQAKRTNPQAANYDMQMLAQLAVDQLVIERLIDQSIKQLGITASPEQLKFYMMDQPINQGLGTLMQQLQQSGLNVQTPQQAYEVIFNPKRNGLTDADVAPLQKAWVALESETAEMIKRNTYQRLMVNSIKANELDRRGLYNDYNTTANVSVAFKPFGVIDEKKFKVSDAELKAEYDKVKEMYALDEPTKAISFLAVNVAPSDADLKASKALAAETVAALSDSAASLPKGLRAKGVATERKELRASDLQAGSVKDYVMTAPKDSVKLLRNDISGFTAVRMIGRSLATDSIEINTVAVAGSTLPAKVLARLNSGVSLDSIQTQYKDSVQVQKDQWIQLLTAQGPTQALEQAQLDSLYKAGGKYIALVTSPQATIYGQLVKRNAPVEVYKYDLVTYQLNPSTQTVNAERDKLFKFLSNHKDAAKFADAAEKAGYTVIEQQVSQSSPAIARYPGAQYFFPNSRQVVRWVMIDGKKGEVSRIYESKDANAPALYAAAITDEYEDYLPYTEKNVKAALENKVRHDKAGEAMMKQYSGKGNVAQTAQAMGVEAQQVPQFRFGGNAQVPDIEVMGRIMGSKPGSKAQMAKGWAGVYVYTVNGLNDEKTTYNKEMYDNQYRQRHNPQFDRMLKGSKKYKNNVYKFEAGE